MEVSSAGSVLVVGGELILLYTSVKDAFKLFAIVFLVGLGLVFGGVLVSADNIGVGVKFGWDLTLKFVVVSELPDFSAVLQASLN